VSLFQQQRSHLGSSRLSEARFYSGDAQGPGGTAFSVENRGPEAPASLRDECWVDGVPVGQRGRYAFSDLLSQWTSPQSAARSARAKYSSISRAGRWLKIASPAEASRGGSVCLRAGRASVRESFLLGSTSTPFVTLVRREEGAFAGQSGDLVDDVASAVCDVVLVGRRGAEQIQLGAE
jgi:hypothetical protein